MKKFSVFLAVLLVAIMAQGCSIGMAFSGSDDFNYNTLEKGASPGITGAKIGSAPIFVERKTDSTKTEVYEITKGDEASTGRGIGWIVLDLATCFIWEIPGTILEATVWGGDDYILTVQYENDQLVDYSAVAK